MVRLLLKNLMLRQVHRRSPFAYITVGIPCPAGSSAVQIHCSGETANGSSKNRTQRQADHGRRLQGQQGRKRLAGNVRIVEKTNCGGSSGVLLHNNFEEMSPPSSFLAELNRSGEHFKSKISKISSTGITGVKKVYFSTYIVLSGNRTTRFFNTEAEALDWLLE